MSDEANPDLESFRQQWRAEVTAKTKGGPSRPQPKSTQQPVKPAGRRPSTVPKPTVAIRKDGHGDDSSSEEDDEDKSEHKAPRQGTHIDDNDDFTKAVTKEPHSALEHYERAVERETQGNLGDSLKLYRKAFRMDDRVDIKYKNKHFPPSSFTAKPTQPNPPNIAATVPNPAHHLPEGPPQSANELISSFAGLSIAAVEPPIEGAPPPPCPLATLPEEILVHILTDVALGDMPSFMRAAQVCKRLAFLTSREDQIWRRICQGEEVGFSGMHYSWKMEVTGEPLMPDFLHDAADNVVEAPAALSDLPLSPPSPTPLDLPLVRQPSIRLSTTYPTYAKMFRYRPRIRYNGIYISTVNYIRPGAAAPSQTTWGSPVHIVTYYRYLRFFRDGSVLSLLTTHEPSEVVHSLLPHLFTTKPPATSPVFRTLKGRWKLGEELEKDGRTELDESALIVETEGFDPKYVYRMELQLKGQERGRSRLMWKGFWNWNRLTDDWGQFGLRNDKTFVFSRVKAYGMGA